MRCFWRVTRRESFEENYSEGITRGDAFRGSLDAVGITRGDAKRSTRCSRLSDFQKRRFGGCYPLVGTVSFRLRVVDMGTPNEKHFEAGVRLPTSKGMRR